MSSQQLLSSEAPRVSAMVAEFNFFPSLYTDKSWWAAYDLTNVYEKLSPIPKAHRRLSQHLLKRLKINNNFDFNFDKKSKKLALLPPQDLQRLAMVLGLVSHASQLRRIVFGSELKRLHKLVGREDSDLALRLSLLCEGRFPSVSADMTQEGLVGAIASHVEERGVSILAKVFGDDISDAFVKRFLLKMPERLNDSYNSDGLEAPLPWLERFAVRTMIAMNIKCRTLLL